MQEKASVGDLAPRVYEAIELLIPRIRWSNIEVTIKTAYGFLTEIAQAVDATVDECNTLASMPRIA